MGSLLDCPRLFAGKQEELASIISGVERDGDGTHGVRVHHGYGVHHGHGVYHGYEVNHESMLSASKKKYVGLQRRKR